MNGNLSKMAARWEKLKRWWRADWTRILAISNIALAVITLLLLVFAIVAYTESVHSLQRDATHEYLDLWNSPYMLQQRKILAHALLPEVQKAGFTRRTPEWPYHWWGLPQGCHHSDTLEVSDLAHLYQGPNPTLTPDSPEFSAFESVRTFFEQLGAAYHSKDFNEHDVFETFSLPAEAYWTTAVSGWLAAQLPSGQKPPSFLLHPLMWLTYKPKAEQGKDATLGTEFREFECRVEEDEEKNGATPIPLGEIVWVLEQDANLPLANAPAADPPVATRSVEKSLVLGPRIPTEYFVTKGVGESDEGIPPDPYETFSYDIALRQASIEDFNVVPYTSVLPPEADEVPLNDVKPTFHHGAVLEVIMAKQGGVRNQTVCAGVGRAWATDAAGKDVGGYAAEYEFAYDNQVSVAAGERDATKQLTRSLNHELAIRGFKQTRQMKFTVACLPIHKKYGMAIAALGFVKFIFPRVEADPSHRAER